jgi:hypothetical protein
MVSKGIWLECLRDLLSTEHTHKTLCATHIVDVTWHMGQ